MFGVIIMIGIYTVLIAGILSFIVYFVHTIFVQNFLKEPYLVKENDFMKTPIFKFILVVSFLLSSIYSISLLVYGDRFYQVYACPIDRNTIKCYRVIAEIEDFGFDDISSKRYSRIFFPNEASIQIDTCDKNQLYYFLPYKAKCSTYDDGEWKITKIKRITDRDVIDKLEKITNYNY